MRRQATARGLALAALLAVEDGARANLVVPQMLGSSNLEERDRAFVTELVYGTLRMRRAVDWLIDGFVNREVDAAVRSALRLGAYQLVYTRVPSHAAVAATVEEVNGPGRGFVNAVLRRMGEKLKRGPLRWPDPATELSYPNWVIARLAKDLGVEPAREALLKMNTPARMTVRPDGYVQDKASQWVAEHLALADSGVPFDQERIVDLCAAPGGKATLLASPRGESGDRPSLVVAADAAPERLRLVSSNAENLELSNVSVVLSDAMCPPWKPGSFDKVLLDAPCSGLGVLRRRPDARWRIQENDVTRLARLQREMLNAALSLVRPGGLLAYSVCTLSAAETVEIDRWLAAEHSELVPESPPGKPWEPLGRGARLLPQSADTDGMYMLLVRRPA